MRLEEIVNTNIHFFLKLHNVPLTKLATVLNQSYRTVILKNKGSRVWTVKDIDKISKFLEVEPLEFFTVKETRIEEEV